MKKISKRLFSLTIIPLFVSLAVFVFGGGARLSTTGLAQAQPTPEPVSAFDQKAALAKLKEQIKGKEQEPASTVFKNIKSTKPIPAGRLLAIMEFGYSRSLGVDCSHCHVPDKWESDEKPQKQIAREMSLMADRINGELLKNIKNLKGQPALVNCTTCHRGQITPTLNLPQPPRSGE